MCTHRAPCTLSGAKTGYLELMPSVEVVARMHIEVCPVRAVIGEVNVVLVGDCKVSVVSDKKDGWGPIQKNAPMAAAS